MSEYVVQWRPAEIPPRRFVAGCDHLDAVLGGGFKIGQVTEVCGESGIGKTILCIQAIVADRYYLTQRGIPSMAIYISTVCTFPVRRLHQICKRYYKEERSAMEDVLVMSADSQDEWNEVLNKLKGYLDAQQSQPKKTRVLVIDSISSLFSYCSRSKAELADQSNQVLSTGYALQRFARDYNMAILVCNNTINSHDASHERNFTTSGRIVKPAVGKPWEKRLANRVLLTWETNAAGTEWTRKICQVKGCELDTGKCEFKVTEAGVTH